MIRPRHILAPMIAVGGFAVALLWIAHPWVSVVGMAVCVGAIGFGIVADCREQR